MPSFENLFPVQKRTLEVLKDHPEADLMVTAPTGSGKTLAYLLPITQQLSSRIVPRIRCLIIVPTTDLTSQVFQVFTTLGTSLHAVTLSTNHSFPHESQQLQIHTPDIVIATPGRLLDHLRKTKSFDLSHLRYLVVDEADRLLNQSYFNWLEVLLSALDPETREIVTVDPPSSLWNRIGLETNEFGLPKNHIRTYRTNDAADGIPQTRTPLQKFIFSATLTQNPEKLASLKLQNPQTIHITTEDTEAVQEKKHAMPETLNEHTVICDSNKLYLLIHVLTELVDKSQGGILVFTRSIKAAHRLSEFINIYFKSQVSSAISSEITPRSRKVLLKQFEKREFQILVASDMYCRGIDFGQFVSTVINYDAPTRAKTYVHRVGRTARANTSGDAYTLLLKKEVKYFKENVVGKCHRAGKVKKFEVEETQFAAFEAEGSRALVELQSRVKGTSVEQQAEEVEENEEEAFEQEIEDETPVQDLADSSDSDVEMETEPVVNPLEVAIQRYLTQNK